MSDTNDMNNMNNMNNMKTIHIIVTGRVQGVGFRYFTIARAKSLGIRGWVRNLPDGSVETLIHGQDEAIDEMIGLLREGPLTAVVADLKIEERGEITAEELSGYAGPAGSPGFTMRL